MNKADLKSKLEEFYSQYNTISFIDNDPILIPKQFTKKEDVEIMAFLISIIAWGQRKSIINSGKRLIEIFDNQPHQFIVDHRDSDLKKCYGFVHRTFNESDLISLISFLKEIYLDGKGLENAFSKHVTESDKNIEKALNGFRRSYENSSSCLERTKKHIASPESGSACKRLNMFLRWMVRKDKAGVDFGIWKSISTSQLICPLDVHVMSEANQLGLIHSEKSNWKTAIELTEKLKQFDKIDPVKYDFALFGSGVNRRKNQLTQSSTIIL